MRWIVAAWVAASALGVPTAAAQRRWPGPASTSTQAELSEARELYERGSEAVDSYHFADGLRLFERSYELSGMGAALFGIGFTLQSMGRFREARDGFNQLLSEHPGLPDEFRDRALRFRAESAARLAVLELSGLPRGVDLTIELDGAGVSDDGRRPLSVECDPGLRRLRAEAPGYTSFDWEGRAHEGERLRLDAALHPLGGSLWQSAWFWIAVGAAVIAGAVVTGIALYGGAQLTPRTPDHIVLCEDC